MESSGAFISVSESPEESGLSEEDAGQPLGEELQRAGEEFGTGRFSTPRSELILERDQSSFLKASFLPVYLTRICGFMSLPVGFLITASKMTFRGTL